MLLRSDRRSHGIAGDPLGHQDNSLATAMQKPSDIKSLSTLEGEGEQSEEQACNVRISQILVKFQGVKNPKVTLLITCIL